MGFSLKKGNDVTKNSSKGQPQEIALNQPMESPKVAIVIPAYNEEASIAETIKDYFSVFPFARIVVVDNNSSDRTAERARSVLRHNIDILLFERKKGKGYAIKNALSRLTADIYVMTDGDLTYPAEDAYKLYKNILETRADMIVGDRRAEGTYSRQNTRPGHKLGNAILTSAISYLAGQKFNDVLSGLRVMSAPFVANLDVRSSGFQLETEINIVSAYLRADVIEQPINYEKRPEGSSSKLSTIRDGIRIICFALLNWIAFSPLQFFSIIAAIGWAAAIFLGYRVISGFLDTGWPYTTTAIVGATCGLIAVFAIFTGLSLRIQGRSERRREIANFLERKRLWNSTIDSKTL